MNLVYDKPENEHIKFSKWDNQGDFELTIIKINSS